MNSSRRGVGLRGLLNISLLFGLFNSRRRTETHWKIKRECLKNFAQSRPGRSKGWPQPVLRAERTLST